MKLISHQKPSNRAGIIDPGLLVPKPVQIDSAIRLGSVPYLNAKPLTYALYTPPTKLEPTKLAAELRAGHLDVALVPVIEVLDAPEDTYRVANHIAIGSEHSVYSVYLNYTVPLQKVRTVALDPASKTSVELARLILEKFHRLTPRYVSTDEPADAQLLIGDLAIAHRQAYPQQNYLDLATAWREYTGLPFVFAVWAIRLPFWKAFGVARRLRAAKAIGMKQRDEIAKTPFERQYLTKHLCYDLGRPQKKAIALFAEMLAESGRIASAPKVSYL